MADSNQVRKSSLSRLLKRNFFLTLLNLGLFVVTATQAYFMYQANQATRDAITQAAEQHKEALASSRSLNEETLRYSQHESRETRAASELQTAQGLAEARRSARIAEEALRLSREANETSRSALQMDQRPWILIKEAALVEQPANVNIARSQIVLTNLGGSPALNVVVRSEMGVTKPTGPLPPSTPFNVMIQSGDTIIKQRDPFANPGIMGPSVDTIHHLSAQVTSEENEALRAERLIAYVRGTVSYTDIFQASHSTSFCFVSARARIPEGTLVMAPCEVGNSAQ